MENAFKSLSTSAKSPSFMASNKHYHGVINHQPPFPQPPATPPQSPLLPLPARLRAPPPQQSAAWPASRSAPQRSKKPSHTTAAAAAAAALGPKKTAPVPIPVQAAPSKKRAAAAATSEQEAADWATMTDSLYSVSPPPSCVPMPTSLLVGAAAGRKAATACAVEVAGGGGVDVGATDELRRLLRL
uniref:Uncharacterized protein n=1 Tax=Oryza meridionalis TaxID=40149 RepID=A0A0E0EUD9_9ORYZ